MERPLGAVTEKVACDALDRFHEELPVAVCEHAQLLFLNVLALAISRAQSDAVDAVVAAALSINGEGPCVVPGRTDRLQPLDAATAIGVAAHLDDFDDTHLTTVIHPSACSLAVVLAVAANRGVTGQSALRAFAVGSEIQLRIGLAMSPAHYDEGWHITGTAGVVGAAVTAGLLVGLDTDRLRSAIGIAACSTIGQREAFGTMTKALHAGKAAANGLLASDLARLGFTGPSDVLEAKRGYFEVLADSFDIGQLLKDFGDRWELLDTMIKPYPCGIVAHPLIDAGRELRARGIGAGNIARLRVECNPLVEDLMGIRQPRDGLEARFSAVHGLACGILDDAVGLGSYTDSHAIDPAVSRLRALIELVPDAKKARDATNVEATLVDGSTERVSVDHARGSLQRPLDRSQVLAKIHGLLSAFPEATAHQLVGAVEGLPEAPDLAALLAIATSIEGLV